MFDSGINKEVQNQPVKLPVAETPAKSERSFRVRITESSEEIVGESTIASKLLRHTADLGDIKINQVVDQVLRGVFDGITQKEFDDLLISTTSNFISDSPDYSKLAGRLLDMKIVREMVDQKIYRFSESIQLACQLGLVSPNTRNFVEENELYLDEVITKDRSANFEYFGLRTVYDRYLLKHPHTRAVIETPQYFFLRVACGLAKSKEEASEIYHMISKFDFMFSTPTLFNSGTLRSQLSSCFLLDSPQDDLMAIYDKYKDIAKLSKYAGGIGVAFHRIRSKGSLIRGTNGKSNGIIPWLKTLDSSVSAVNQGGKRKGACCVYLETWHADIEEFLELRNNTGDESRRTHNLNLSNWIPDLFMERVEADAMWSLFDPAKMTHFPDLYGKEFNKAFIEAEEKKLYEKQIPARTLYMKMMKTLAETGNGWINFKDASNLKCNQTKNPENVVHLSNLCTEILEVTSKNETAVCNLGSVNLSMHVEDGEFNFDKLGKTVRTAVKYLDRVIDRNYYPLNNAKESNNRWRPIGLGVMGLQDVFFKLGLSFETEKAKNLASKIQEEVYYNALLTSNGLAQQFGAHASFHETRASDGHLQFDLWGVKPTKERQWAELKEQIKAFGLRNSLTIAIAPTATIASVVGCYEAIEPQVSNLFKRETLSGEFIQINKYLVKQLNDLGLWDQNMKRKLLESEGSIQDIAEIPKAIRDIYKTAWELSMKAVIDMAAARGPYIDQSQSLNLFIENPTIGKVSSMYMYAWKAGIKTTYYLRSRSATKIQKTLGNTAKTFTEAEAVACSLENPDACEACQ